MLGTPPFLLSLVTECVCVCVLGVVLLLHLVTLGREDGEVVGPGLNP